MNLAKVQEALIILQEECGEVVQVVAKCHRFGLDGVNPLDNSINKDNLAAEIGDLVCMIEILQELGVLDQQLIHDRATMKRHKLERWSTLFAPDPVETTLYNLDQNV